MGEDWYAVVLAVDDASMAAARRLDALTYWINDKVPGATELILTDGPAGDQPGIYYNLGTDETVYVTMFFYGVTTLGDDCRFELGSCDAINGGGTFTPQTPLKVHKTGAAASSFITPEFEISPPMRLAYADGVRSITMRVDANDAACSIACGWRGFIERTPS
jgi:hypothetical protein